LQSSAEFVVFAVVVVVVVAVFVVDVSMDKSFHLGGGCSFVELIFVEELSSEWFLLPSSRLLLIGDGIFDSIPLTGWADSRNNFESTFEASSQIVRFCFGLAFLGTDFSSTIFISGSKFTILFL